MSVIQIRRILGYLGLLFGFIPALSLAADKVASQVTVQWLGHASFKLTSVAGKVILIDPYITKPPKLSVEQKDLTKLGKVDLILVTHAHGDHEGDGPAHREDEPLDFRKQAQSTCHSLKLKIIY